MKRVGSIRDVLDVAFELPAGADPYEQFDFQYAAEEQSEEELRKTWRVFTKVKDLLDNGRRMENASWRLWFRERNRSGALSTAQSTERLSELDPIRAPADMEKFERSLRQAEEQADRLRGDMFTGPIGDKFEKDEAHLAERAKIERARDLLDMAHRHGFPDDALDELLAWLHIELRDADALGTDALPRNRRAAVNTVALAKVMPRPRVAVFCHSLERNGANNFLLYLLRELREELSFSVFSPKEGAMRADYESMGMCVSIVDTKSSRYPARVRSIITGFSYAIANTIMTTEVINAARELDTPCLWVIHEAWPKGQFDYYAKDVFMMTHLDARAIVSAFSNASRIIFPAQVQRSCYEGLFSPPRARVIYNGIPLKSIDAYRSMQSRDRVRAELGYGPNDFLLVHMGTVCKRKGQLVSSRALARLANEVILPGEREWKLLMVGARYIRQHEIDYIADCQRVLSDAGVADLATVLDVRKNVLPFYLAADVVLCPSLNEVLPLVICEAMAFERPVIASRIDGIPEALSHGEEGFLIPPSDPSALYEAINRLAQDDDLRKRMGAAGRQRVLRQFSFKTMSTNYRDTIRLDLEIPVHSTNGHPVAATVA